MTTITSETKALHEQMKRVQKRNRAFTYVVAILIALWILIPIFFIFSMAFTTQETVRL